MISAVVPPRPLAQPQLPPKVPPLTPASVKDRAAAGYFRDLALWLNEPLVDQGIFVQVQADQQPGCLKLTVEFERTPIQDRLARFLCHRIWQLNSELIEGIYILARPVGWQRVLWKQRIKISTPALRRRQANDQLTQAAAKVGSPLPPSLSRPRRRAKANSSLPISQRFKTLRVVMLSGSAVAAFVLGCLLEIASSGVSPSLPSFSAQGTGSRPRLATEAVSPQGGDLGGGQVEGSADDRPFPTTMDGAGLALEEDPGVSQAIAATATAANAPRPPRAPGSTPRPSVVDTALEPVAVIPHTKPSPMSVDQVNLLFGGDIALDDLDFAQIEAEGGFFAEVEAYVDADVSLVNLATPLATAATSLNEEFRQQTRPEAARMLANSGIDMINLTHSNLMQYGAEGLSETLTALDRHGIYRVGAGRNATEARRPEILDVKGKRIAYLSYAMGGNNAAIDTSALKDRAGASNEAVAREVENFKRATAFQDRAGFNAQNMPEIVQDLQAIRDQVDWIVVNFRWVDHLEETPNFVQTNLARLAIDQGADVVVGYHPTVIQGGEIYKGRPIAYSLGDFVFKPDQPLQDQESAVLKVALQADQMQVEFVPVRIRDSRPQTLTGAAGQAVLQRIQTASSQFEVPLQSSVVLDRSAPAMVPPEALDPDSPFVTPDAEEILILEPAPSVDLDLTGDDSTEPATEETLDPPLPEGEPNLNLQHLDQGLPEWGPKVSPKEREFQPVPQNRSGAEDPSLEAQAQPDLLRRLVESLRLASPETAAEEAWNDTVPAVPTTPALSPGAPLEVSPAPLSLDSDAGKAAATPSAAIPSAEAVPGASLNLAPDLAPDANAPTLVTDAPEPEYLAAPAGDEGLESVEGGHKAEDSEEEGGSAEMENAMPTTKVIPPEAEPLVGPLGFADEVIETSVAQGDSSAPALVAEDP